MWPTSRAKLEGMGKAEGGGKGADSRVSDAPLLVGGPRRSELARRPASRSPWRKLLGDARSITRSFDGRGDPRRWTRWLTSKRYFDSHWISWTVARTGFGGCPDIKREREIYLSSRIRWERARYGVLCCSWEAASSWPIPRPIHPRSYSIGCSNPKIAMRTSVMMRTADRRFLYFVYIKK